jgi:hypothetical protein
MVKLKIVSVLVHQKETKLIICKPIDLIFLHLVLLKQNMFLSSQITHITAPLTVSIRTTSFKGILESKYHRLARPIPVKVKLLCVAIHCHIELIKEYVTNK